MQVLMFSATLHSQEVKDVAAKICQQPIVVDLKVWHHCNRHEHYCMKDYRLIQHSAVHLCNDSPPSTCHLSPLECVQHITSACVAVSAASLGEGFSQELQSALHSFTPCLHVC